MEKTFFYVNLSLRNARQQNELIVKIIRIEIDKI